MTTEAERKKRSANEYLAINKVHTLFEQLTAELVLYKPNKPLDYMQLRIREIVSGKTETDVPSVVFVVGPPGSGKGVHCAKLVEAYGLAHLSPEDVLVNEVRSQSEEGIVIDEMLRTGQSMPATVIINLLNREIRKVNTNTIILVDNFPNDLSEAIQFEQQVVEPRFVLYLACPDSVCEERLAQRHDADGVSMVMNDYNAHHHERQAVVAYYKALQKLHTVNADQDLDKVWRDVEQLFK
eukprot:TRINITY_DN66991_c2_g5_i1.p1 TRINITY_DN66991_c2_g5~~TRINITY_DN66991_c2_g5_i1.p1  ORF type:complete len:256 (+),score=12.86 TRINITY_DN66991_c2_g5_i1:54-770(+)